MGALLAHAEELGDLRVLASAFVDLEHIERDLRDRLDALGPAPRAELPRSSFGVS